MILLLQYTLIFASVLILVALGGCFAEHSGVINLGLEGIMIMGALGGALTMRYVPNTAPAIVMLLAVIVVSALVGMVYSCLLAVASINFKADQTLVGTALNLLGTAGANLIGMIFSTDWVVHACSTAFTTELLGWGTILVGNILSRLHLLSGTTRMPRMRWLIAVVCTIFLFRLSIIAFSDMNIISDGGLYRNMIKLLNNIPVCIILLCLNILYVSFARMRLSGKPSYARWSALICFQILAILGSTLAVSCGIPFSIHPLPSFHNIAETGVVVFIAEMLFYALTYMADYVWVTHQDVKAEKMKRHKAQFEYLKLKQQVNPHFLFNSLNILDYLICENKNEDASTFVHKLAGVYRYMLKNGVLELINLRDELAFTGMYADLLKVRFSSGFEVNAVVPEQFMSCRVVPCSIQMLLENAMKHNRVSQENPLLITISVHGGMIVVTNNKSPKMTASEESTKVGLNYIRQQYIDLSGKDIEVNDNGDTYSVSLPLLPAPKTT